MHNCVGKAFNSCPSNMAGQRHQDELIWYSHAWFISNRDCLRLLITFKTVKTCFSSLKIYKRQFSTIRSTYNLALFLTLMNTTGAVMEDDWWSGIHTVIKYSICVWVCEVSSLGRMQVGKFYILMFPTAMTWKKPLQLMWLFSTIPDMYNKLNIDMVTITAVSRVYTVSANKS